MLDGSDVPTSRVCVLSTHRFERLISSSIGLELCQWFRILVQTSSVSHDSDSRGFLARYWLWELWETRSFSGSKVLQHLESSLSKTSIAKAPLERLKAFFLVLFGTIVAVQYANAICEVKNVSHCSFEVKSTIAKCAHKSSELPMLANIFFLFLRTV